MLLFVLWRYTYFRAVRCWACHGKCWCTWLRKSFGFVICFQCRAHSIVLFWMCVGPLPLRWFHHLCTAVWYFTICAACCRCTCARCTLPVLGTVVEYCMYIYIYIRLLVAPRNDVALTTRRRTSFHFFFFFLVVRTAQ